MLQTRGELYGKAREMYRTLLTRTARRYDYEIPYVVSDSVGYSCTRIEELFRPMWGICGRAIFKYPIKTDPAARTLFCGA